MGHGGLTGVRFAWFLRIVAVVSTLVLSLETRTQKSKKLTSRGKRFFKK